MTKKNTVKKHLIVLMKYAIIGINLYFGGQITFGTAVYGKPDFFAY